MDNLLFSMPLFRGTKNQRIFVFKNFYQAMQGIANENLLFVEHFANINFYADGCQKQPLSQPKRIYLAEIKSYEELHYLAINDKWLKVPQDFMYDKSYQYQKFLFSRNAREIVKFPQLEFIALSEKFLQAFQGKCHIQLKGAEHLLNVQQDIKCFWGDGLQIQELAPQQDLISALKNLLRQNKNFIHLKINVVNFKFDAQAHRIKTINIYFKENKISVPEARKKSNNSPRIEAAIANGEKNFVYNPSKGIVAPAHHAVFVPRNIIFNKWKI